MNRRPLPPATAPFLTVMVGVGFVVHVFGVEAGLLALILAVVALVAAPWVFLPNTHQRKDQKSTQQNPELDGGYSDEIE